MPNQQLIDYIKQAQATGQSQETIRSTLLGAGWQIADVEEALSLVSSPIQSIGASRSPRLIIIIASIAAVFLLAGGGFAYWHFMYVSKMPHPYAVAVTTTNGSNIATLLPGTNLWTLLPGTNLWTFTFKIINTGDNEDTYALTLASSNSKWIVTHQIPSSVSLKYQEEKLFKVDVIVPVNTKIGDANTINLRADSVHNQNIFDVGRMEITIQSEYFVRDFQRKSNADALVIANLKYAREQQKHVVATETNASCPEGWAINAQAGIGCPDLTVGNPKLSIFIKDLPKDLAADTYMYINHDTDSTFCIGVKLEEPHSLFLCDARGCREKTGTTTGVAGAWVVADCPEGMPGELITIEDM